MKWWRERCHLSTLKFNISKSFYHELTPCFFNPQHQKKSLNALYLSHFNSIITHHHLIRDRATHFNRHTVRILRIWWVMWKKLSENVLNILFLLPSVLFWTFWTKRKKRQHNRLISIFNLKSNPLLFYDFISQFTVKWLKRITATDNLMFVFLHLLNFCARCVTALLGMTPIKMTFT